MGNCGNKPMTAEGDAPAPEDKPVESTSRDVVLEDTKVISTDHADDVITPRSLAQMLEEEEKKPEGTVEAMKPAEEPPVVEMPKAEVSEPKPKEATPVAVEEKKVEAPVAKA